MEVIHLILGKANPGRMNGVNKVVDQLAAQQKAAGMHVEVWGITANPVHDYPQRNYTTRLFRTGRYPFAVPGGLVNAISNSNNQAVFHLHGGFVPAMYTASRILHAQRRPFVFTPHGSYNLIARQRSRLKKTLYFRLFEKVLLKNAHKVHALGQSEVDGLQQIFPNNKSVLIPYGFEMESIAPRLPGHDSFVVGFCGRLDVYTKGLNELLEGFALFRRYQPGGQLWLIGDGRERPALEQKVRLLQLQDSIVFWGSKYGEEKMSLLKKCSLFAAPSRNEGLPTAVLEAASIGRPCLVTEATNTGAAIRRYDAGEVIAYTDPMLIAAALLRLHHRMSDAATRQLLSQNSRRMVAAEYNWQGIVHQYKNLYRL